MTRGRATRAEIVVLATIGYVAAMATVSLVLAAAGAHAAAPPLAAVGAVGVLVAGARAVREAVPDRAGVLVVLGAFVVGALLYVPAFPYGSSDRDAGVYAQTTYAIARTGSLYVPDPLADRPPELHATHDGQRVAGVHPTGDTALPGFFLAEPALRATVHQVFGDLGARLVNPFIGMLAVAAFGLLVKRLVNPLAGALTVALMAGTMVQVWQAKTPGPEMLAQLSVAGALLAAVAGMPMASGVLTTFVWVVRPDGVLVFLLGLAFGRDRRYLTGLLTMAPVALWQTYLLADDYAARNGIPPWPVLLLVAAAAFVSGRYVTRFAPIAKRIAPYVAAVFAVALLIRQALASQPPPLDPGAAPEGYAPFTVGRIADLVTGPALVLALIGVAYAARNRPLLLAPAVLGAPYLVDPRISPDLMFWGRRFVPLVLPGIAILAAVGATALIAWRLAPVAAVALAVALVVPYAQSWPLRFHEEYGGGLEAAEVAANASYGEQATYIWIKTRENCCDQPAYLLAGAVWLRYGKGSMAVWPEDAPAEARAATTLNRPVLVVAPGTERPFEGLTYVLRYATTIEVWERGGLRRPDSARHVPLEFTVWRYAATPS